MIQSSVSNLLLVLVFVFLGLWALSVVSRLWFAYQSYRCLKSRSSKARFLTLDVAQLFAGVPLRQVIEEQEATRRGGAHILMHSLAIPCAPVDEPGRCGPSPPTDSSSSLGNLKLLHQSGGHVSGDVSGIFAENGKLLLKVGFAGFRLSDDWTLQGSLVQTAVSADPHEILNGLRCHRSLRMISSAVSRGSAAREESTSQMLQVPKKSQVTIDTTAQDDLFEETATRPQLSREAVEERASRNSRIGEHSTVALLTTPLEPAEWENAQKSMTVGGTGGVDTFLWVDALGPLSPLSLVYRLALAHTVEVECSTVAEATTTTKGEGSIVASDITLIENDGTVLPEVTLSNTGATKLADASFQLAYVMSGHRLYEARAVYHLRESGDDDKELCLVCFASAKATIFIPCGHYACCMVCARKLSHCPICRTEVTFTVCVLRDAK